MTRVAASADVPGPLQDVRALWFDVSRWPAFVDGFGAVARMDPDWPETGEVMWNSTPKGRGRVIERADGSFEDPRLRGTQTVRFEPVGDGRVRVTVEQTYTLKDRNPLTPLVDLLFIRRSVAESLARTVRRFAAEAEHDAELRAGAGEP